MFIMIQKCTQLTHRWVPQSNKIVSNYLFQVASNNTTGNSEPTVTALGHYVYTGHYNVYEDIMCNVTVENEYMYTNMI